MQEAEIMCQRVAFIRQGKILKLATPAELKSAYGKKEQ
jgi:ABC-type multidrug transport system ATPase subunit